MNTRISSLAIFIALWSAIGCAAPDVVDDSQQHQPQLLEPGIWEVDTGERWSIDEWIDEVADATFIVVGESHGTPFDHQVQYEIYEGLVEVDPEPVALGLEMMEYRFQDAVDAYVAGDIDEVQMLRDVKWDERWGVDEELYAPMWRLAREERQPVVALNARRELVSEVGEVGIEGLDAGQRGELPEIDTDDQAYREHLRSIFAAHGAGDDDEALDRFFEAQLVWDETMAQQAFEFVDERDDVSQMVILTGRGHMEGGFGIPPRLVRRGASEASVVTIVPVVTEGPRAEMMEEYRNLEKLRDDDVADFVWLE